ncbi:MAG: hypothetical protein ABEJ76_05640 [Halanaeroarchaeum sp.]
MTIRRIALVGLAALVVATGTVAAVPSSTDSQTTDAAPADPTKRADNGWGPPVELPDVVPEHVSDVHRTIQSFLDGSLDGPLGEALRDLLGPDRPGGDDHGPAPEGG